jgi:hypothetical protein
MTCLTDARIQAVADREATAAESAHVTACAHCAERVRERQGALAALEHAMAGGPAMPPAAARRIEMSLRQGGGATRLHGNMTSPFRRRALVSGVALAAATLALIVFVPLLMTDRGAVTAAEILAESASRLTAANAAGVEILEYELNIDGVPGDVVPQHPGGTHRIWKAIDHTMPGRYRFATYAPDGRLLSAIAQDPARGTRTIVMTIDRQVYRFEFTLPADPGPSLPEIEQLHMQASVGMMQASGQQMLEIVDTPSGRQYRIEVPEVVETSGNPVWDLTQARVVIDANDYRITEFAAKGMFLRQPYSVAYKLNRREITAAAAPDLFEIPAIAGQMTLQGEGTVAPPRDAFVLALRELSKMKQDAR